ncbi:hypothetical protein SAMN05444371_3073 [Epilithonimonas mollis]|uniref:Uncharacterized protein n=1 Tax=Epilithonimonas mollis TaxID=216903 RepID=A0A1M6U212_9FLAO|nr:hypothetical protein SAMN05444371_3073 [Epilithonimonas mollis]
MKWKIFGKIRTIILLSYLINKIIRYVKLSIATIYTKLVFGSTIQNIEIGPTLIAIIDVLKTS